jgi:cytoplasmic tRNA 2-thiolation protein 1
VRTGSLQSPTCGTCHTRPSFYKRDYEGVNLCKSCFKDSVERRVRRTISHWQMFLPNDHIAVAVSGGKDSLTLLTILKKLTARFSQAKITAVTVDEGIAGYREEAVDLASEFCEKLEVDHEIVSFKELYGNGLDDFLREKHGRMSACSYCGVFRRKAINVGARRVGATRIATAHNLDDVVQTYLLNLFQGDVDRFARFSPVLNDPRGGFLPRVKPLCEVPEREVALYGFVEGLTFQSASCPYMAEALRNELRTVLNRLEQAHPGVLFTSYRAMTRLSELAGPNVPPSVLHECESCGEPTPMKICEACRMVGVSGESQQIPA